MLPFNEGYSQFMIYFSALSSFGGFIQVAHLFREKTAVGRKQEVNGVSYVAWGMSVVSNICWLMYGFMIADYAVIFSCAIGLGGSTSVLSFIVYYKMYDDKEAVVHDAEMNKRAMVKALNDRLKLKDDLWCGVWFLDEVRALLLRMQDHDDNSGAGDGVAYTPLQQQHNANK